MYAHDDPTDIFPTSSGSYPKYGSTDVDMVYNSAVQQYFEINPNNPSGCSVGTTCVYTVLILVKLIWLRQILNWPTSNWRILFNS